MASRSPIRVACQDEAGTPIGRLRVTGYAEHVRAFVPRRPWVAFDSYVLTLVHDGAGTYVDDATPERPVEAGDTILVTPGHRHWYAPLAGGGWRETFALFDGPVFDTLAAARVLDVHEPVRRIAPTGIWRRQLRAFVDGPRPSAPLERQREILEFAALLLQLRGGADERVSALHPAMRRACDMLASDLGVRLEAQDVAHAVDMPYETFRKRFRAATGTSPVAYRADRRIEAAKTLLRTTWMTHASIAKHLGFADEFHFARRFRQKAGMSPREYRRSDTTL